MTTDTAPTLDELRGNVEAAVERLRIARTEGDHPDQVRGLMYEVTDARVALRNALRAAESAAAAPARPSYPARLAREVHLADLPGMVGRILPVGALVDVELIDVMAEHRSVVVAHDGRRIVVEATAVEPLDPWQARALIAEHALNALVDVVEHRTRRGWTRTPYAEVEVARRALVATGGRPDGEPLTVPTGGRGR